MLLHPETMYCFDWAGSVADKDGHHMFAPPELPKAVAYALTDRAPCAKLVQAAKSVKLRSADDVRREVTRLLANPKPPRRSPGWPPAPQRGVPSANPLPPPTRLVNLCAYTLNGNFWNSQKNKAFLETRLFQYSPPFRLFPTFAAPFFAPLLAAEADGGQAALGMLPGAVRPENVRR